FERAPHAGLLPLDDLARRDLVGEGVDVAPELFSGHLDVGAELVGVGGCAGGAHDLFSSFLLSASGISLTVSTVRGAPRTARSRLMPTAYSTAAIAAQTTATMTAAHPSSITSASARHRAIDRNRSVIAAPYAAAAISPEPTPARFADSASSAFASSSSWRISTDTSRVTSPTSSPSDVFAAFSWEG